MQTWDYVCYNGITKEIITILYDVIDEPKFIINVNYVGIVIPHDEYKIEYIDDVGYFKALNNVTYLDDYRGRYID